MSFILPTTEEAEAIRNGDKELKDRYYLGNRSRIEFAAKCYTRYTFFNDWEDLAQEVYLRFQDLDFRRSSYFNRSLFDIFYHYRFGGKRKIDQLCDARKKTKVKYKIEYPELVIFDRPLSNSSGTTFGELIPYDFDFYEEIEPTYSITDDFYNYLCSYLTVGEKEVFEHSYYSKITISEIANKIGMSAPCVVARRGSYMKKFRRHANELRSWLTDMGYYPAA